MILSKNVEIRIPKFFHYIPNRFFTFFTSTASGVNFTNVLRAAFTLIDPESVKKIDNLTEFFTLLGYACVKAVCRTLMKLSLGVNFINMLMWSFHSRKWSDTQLIFHQQYYTQFYKYTQLEVWQNVTVGGGGV